MLKRESLYTPPSVEHYFNSLKNPGCKNKKSEKVTHTLEGIEHMTLRFTDITAMITANWTLGDE